MGDADFRRELGQQLRVDSVRASAAAGSAHPTSSMSAADLIAVPGNPLEKIDALRDVQFVMKDGVVFKQKGVITPGPFFHGGPEYGLVR